MIIEQEAQVIFLSDMETSLAGNNVKCSKVLSPKSYPLVHIRWYVIDEAGIHMYAVSINIGL